MENIFWNMENIILISEKMINQIGKKKNIMQMEILSMKVILLMVNKKEMENILMKMMNIKLVNAKMI